ncbi:hypothetical protein HOU00_gp213 [Caulobacter phage CcrPW]|uniref:Uncharacterized protein n=1 Tax=Caulobacter phage CcrPW TaxID=2283271 RepID=A0A385EDI3_9CAUD|nr:hypothetical protein HOU00_gp213 [Caulobacter phage CcrPW]AXQ68912.1 hypothetical protein CcrPW_gp373c [Caulobacter phage CcrPW]
MAHHYDTVRRDFETLERIAELSDQVELDARRLDLMRTPTKAKAADLYHSAILMWFNEHGEDAAPELAEVYL